MKSIILLMLVVRGGGHVRSLQALFRINGRTLSYKYFCLSTVKPAGLINGGWLSGISDGSHVSIDTCSSGVLLVFPTNTFPGNSDENWKCRICPIPWMGLKYLARYLSHSPFPSVLTGKELRHITKSRITDNLKYQLSILNHDVDNTS